MRQFVYKSAVFMVAALALAGCLNEKREFTLNANGSGKVTYEARLPLMDMPGDAAGADAQKNARKEAAKILSASEGVDAWKDVSWEVDKDGKLFFKGTAYFTDLNTLNIHGSMKGGTQPTWKLDAGTVTLVIANVKAKTPPEAKPTDAEIAQRATAARNLFKQQLPMFSAMLGDYRSEWTFALPGAPENTVNFATPAGRANTVQLVHDGPKMLETLNKLKDDEAFWKAQAATGGDFQKDGPDENLLNEKLFGTRGSIRTAVRAPLKDRFDYAAEVAAAKAGQAAMMEGLKLDVAPAVAPPAQGGAFKQLRIAGACLVTESDNEKNISPFNREKGYAISLVGELPGSVLTVKEGEVKTAVADTGDNLLSAEDWDRKINWPRLSEDKATVSFDVQTLLPGPNVKGFKEISGTLTYQVATGTKDVDLGMVALKVGAKGAALDAEIKSVGKSEWQEGQSELQLSLQANANAIKEVRFLDAQGGKIEASRQGTSSFGEESCELTFTRKGEFPAQARIVVQMHDNLKEYLIPFKIENIDLLGRTR